MSDKAKRNKIDRRFDLIPAPCLDDVARVFAEGAEKYGEKNWQKSRLTDGDGPINHAMKHINNYTLGIDNDGDLPITHLTHAIVNLMFEFYYEYNQL